MLLVAQRLRHQLPCLFQSCCCASGLSSSTRATLSTDQPRHSSDPSSTSSTSTSADKEAAWSEAEYLQDYEQQLEEEEGQGQVGDRQQLLRQLLRRTHAAEVRPQLMVLAGVGQQLMRKPPSSVYMCKPAWLGASCFDGTCKALQRSTPCQPLPPPVAWMHVHPCACRLP